MKAESAFDVQRCSPLKTISNLESYFDFKVRGPRGGPPMVGCDETRIYIGIDEEEDAMKNM